MLRLNYELLTSDLIIAWFEKNLAQLDMAPKDAKTPSHLRQLKTKLKAAFFEDMKKAASDEEVLHQLGIDERFISDYPKLNDVLHIIFNLNDEDNKAQALEELNNITSTDWDTTSARSKFDELNTRFGYFNPPSEHLYTLFTDMAISCRTMAVLFEKNNTPEDTMAYDYAYKLMALFIDPAHPEQASLDSLAKETYKLVNNINNDKHHPFHEALLVQLEPLPQAHHITDHQGWRALIQKHGEQALPFFMMAQQIEEKIAALPDGQRRAPKSDDNLSEAKHMHALCWYKRTSEDPEFAKLCKQHNTSEEVFNACLNYLAEPPGWPKKTSDNLPNLTIQGEGRAEGLFWLKLPLTDKRALILGKITYCCQSIAGHSEQCVKDAVSLSDNGLYVLLKQKKKGSPALIESGQINEKDFKIIGQSYVWTSMLGNLCLDSLECLNGEITNEALQAMIAKFGENVLEQYPDINYVTVGCGGNTPSGLFKETSIPETMRQGMAYGDASRQYCIAESPLTLTSEHEKVLDAIFKNHPENDRNYLKRHVKENDSNHLVATLQTLFDTSEQGLVNQHLLTTNPHPDKVMALLTMHQAELLYGPYAQATCNSLLKHKTPRSAAKALVTLNQASFLSEEHTQANRDAVLQHQKPENIATILVILNQTDLLSGEHAQANLDEVLNHQDPRSLAKALVILSQADLLSGKHAQANLHTVLKHQDPISLAKALVILSQASFLSEEHAQTNRDYVLKHKSPENIATILVTLNQTDLLSGEHAQANRDEVLKHQDPISLAGALVILSQANLLSGEHAQANLDDVLKHQNPESLAKALVTLSQASFLSEEHAQTNRDNVLKHKSPENIAPILVALSQTDLLSGEHAQANRDEVLKHQDPIRLAGTLVILSQTDLLSGEHAQANLHTVLNYPKPYRIVDALGVLSKADLLSGDYAQANLDAVLNHQNPLDVANAFINLSRASLLSGEQGQANRDAVLNHKNLKDVVIALIRLNHVDLLSGDHAQATLDNLLKHQDPWTAAMALASLSQANLLSGRQGKANFDAVLYHQDPINIAKALIILNQAGLLSEEQAQANCDVLLKHKHPNPKNIAETLITLNQAGLLSGEQGQANRNVLLNHQEPKQIADTLTALYSANLLSKEQVQVTFNRVSLLMELFLEMKIDKVFLELGIDEDNVEHMNRIKITFFCNVIGNLNLKKISGDDKVTVQDELLSTLKSNVDDKKSILGRLFQACEHSKRDKLLRFIIATKENTTDFKNKFKELVSKERPDEEPSPNSSHSSHKRH